VNLLNAEVLAQKYPRVEFVTPPRTSEFPEEWYEANSEDHFWFQWRARAAAALIDRIGLPTNQPLRVFDIGCGTGITCQQFRRTTSWVFDGADLNTEALARCDAGMARVLYYDISEKRPEFRELYDVIILFDVVEHIEPTRPFLEAALFHLKPGGVVLVNVPALQGLFSVYDTVAGHYRRYTLDSLAAEFAAFDVSVIDRTYWGFSMVPLLWLRKQLLRGQKDQNQTIRTGFVPPSSAAHALLKAGMKIETAVLKHPPAGSSVMMAVRRRS
jgi:2-polyprenyl-3-methyl-5-hydroxy-6-metoxy-1,4-benzoquinol methylase